MSIPPKLPPQATLPVAQDENGNIAIIESEEALDTTLKILVKELVRLSSEHVRHGHSASSKVDEAPLKGKVRITLAKGITGQADTHAEYAQTAEAIVTIWKKKHAIEKGKRIENQTFFDRERTSLLKTMGALRADNLKLRANYANLTNTHKALAAKYQEVAPLLPHRDHSQTQSDANPYRNEEVAVSVPRSNMLV